MTSALVDNGLKNVFISDSGKIHIRKIGDDWEVIHRISNKVLLRTPSLDHAIALGNKEEKVECYSR